MSVLSPVWKLPDHVQHDHLRVIWPPNWHSDMRSDFYWPLVTSSALTVAIEVVRA